MASIFDILKEDSSNNKNDDINLDINLEAEDDFSIDTSLDDNSGDAGNASPDDMSTSQQAADEIEQDQDALGDSIEDTDGTGTRDSGSGSDDLGGGDLGGGSGESDELSDEDKDLFFTLPKEDQEIKIMQLKELFGNLYSTCNDIIDKIDNLDLEGDRLEAVGYVSGALFELKSNIKTYLIYSFQHKSYIENDAKYNTYLMCINSLASVLEEMCKKFEKEDKE